MFEDLEVRRAEIDRHRENSARLASAFAKFETTGQGFVEFKDVIDFGCTFTEEPYPAYGSRVDLEALEDLLQQEAVVDKAPPPVPITSGVVTEWDQDDKGYYIGAWVGVRVFFPYEDAVPLDLDVPAEHYFTFTGVAIKDVPIDVRE